MTDTETEHTQAGSTDSAATGQAATEAIRQAGIRAYIGNFGTEETAEQKTVRARSLKSVSPCTASVLAFQSVQFHFFSSFFSSPAGGFPAVFPFSHDPTGD